MSTSVLQLALVDPDPIFRLGLKTSLQAVSGLQVVADGPTSLSVLEQLPSSEQENAQPPVNLVILDWSVQENPPEPQWQALQQAYQPWESRYPQLGVLLLTGKADLETLAFAQVLGVRGYCRKGMAIADLIQAIRTCATGETYGFAILEPSPAAPLRGRMLARWRDRLYQSGIEQIEAAIAELSGYLQNPALPVLERAVIAGRLRELAAARWVVNQLLAAPPSPNNAPPIPPPPENTTAKRPPISPRSALVPAAESSLNLQSEVALEGSLNRLFAALEAQLQYSLKNLTDEPLEIDILREEKRRELLKIILQRLTETVRELQLGQVNVLSLSQKVDAILQDLWSASITDFFGKYYHIKIANTEYDLVPILLENIPRIQSEILKKIPLVLELFSYWLYETPLMIENVLYSYGTPEADKRAEILAQNLIIQVANAVIQPLLNRFADIVEIKQDFYDKQLLSTREIERFRNDLSWKYRQVELFGEPQNMFESQYVLLALDYRGIKKVKIYHPRRQELERLRGVRYAVTLLLEARDAIAPRIRAILSFLGSGVIYLLTQIVGRGIGLIGRGILQGLGSSIPESRFSRNSDSRK
ncbi:DUF3685 domain-containing protein [Oscillatoria laete-virens NRMC-F 0139]|nr:DUF3685 domain-containing protein [Oscillatoria laete-virens]MDL5052585.1 DUF3685 domain-containing protein [Oscillatoria laete-virens NRMC-F 0139]